MQTGISSAPLQIPPRMFKTLCDAIGDQLEFQDLDDIIYRIFSDHKINNWANKHNPRRQIAEDCIQGIEREGMTVAFLACVMKLGFVDQELRQLITTAVPAVETAFQPIEATIPKLIDAFDGMRVRMSNPDIKAALVDSRGVLENLLRGIIRLDSYKHLHDLLHRIQVGAYKALLSSVHVEEDDTQFDEICEYKDGLQTDINCAKMAVQDLTDDEKPAETAWICKLDDIVDQLDKAITNRNLNQVTFVVSSLSAVLRNQSPRLNELILNEARRLPLGVLIGAFGAMSDGDPEIRNLMNMLSSVENTLVSQIAEHNQWQNLDNKIWDLEDTFSQSAHPVEDFARLWVITKASLRPLISLNPSAKWSRKLSECYPRVDKELPALDPQNLTTYGEQVPKNAVSAFDEFRHQVRMVFFMVDRHLMQDCDLLMGIRQPVEQILRELSDGRHGERA